jgi:nucleotide-binding universal stress UspA family protein
MLQQGKPQARRTPFMSIFPTKILLATDGSTEAELAARSAVDLSQKTDSELHLIHVMDVAKVGLSMAVLYSEATDPEGVKLPDPVLEEELERSAKQGAGRCSARKCTGYVRLVG